MKCIICGSNIFSAISNRVRDSKSHRVVKCKKCGFIQLYPRPSLKEEQEFYDKNLQSKNIKLPDDLKIIQLNSLYDTKRRAEFVSNYCNTKDYILDVGSGDGFFLKEMQDRGYKILGIETSEERRKNSKKITDVEVLNINLLKNNFPENLKKFDCITLFHVLEHIFDPILFLKNIKNNFLKNSGKIIIEVPNIENLLVLDSKYYKKFHWQRGHLFYFNEKTLVKVVKKAGFSIKNTHYIQRYGLENFMQWFLIGKPQILKPNFHIEGKYKWLEDYYKNYLCKIGKSDTLLVVAENK